MTVKRIALQASLALDQKPRWKRALHHATKHYEGEVHVRQRLWFWRRGAIAASKPTNAFWHPGVVISNTLATVWTAYRRSVVKYARSQVRPFHDDDEAAHEHEHATEHMRKLGERLLHDGDFPCEDVTLERRNSAVERSHKQPWIHARRAASLCQEPGQCTS